MLNLGPFGQLPKLASYTLLTLAFSVKDESEQTVILQLEKAANEIVLSYPWVAGQVVHEKSEDEREPNSGTYRIVKYDPHEQSSKFVHVKDCRDLCPSYTDIVKARAPLSMLDGSIISPAKGFPCMYPTDVPQPVILMQANFIRGGLLLTSCAQHQTMDANGHEQFLRQFARLCRGEKLLEEHVRMGNANQQTIFPPLDPGQTPSPLELIRCPSKLNDPPSTWPPSGSGDRWRLFKSTASKIAALKIEASKDVTSGSYISSNDAVTTLIWTRLAAVRSRMLPKDSRTMLFRAVNGRKRLSSPISEGYMGHSILISITSSPLQNILSDSLSSLTIKVRQSLMTVNDHEVRSFFSLVKSEKDKTTFNYASKMNSETDLLFTSFAAQQLYRESFGTLGMPDFVRRPRLPDGMGVCYLMPMTREGDIDFVIGLSNEEFEGLKGDAKWKDYAEVIE
jgi:hypothetical protein